MNGPAEAVAEKYRWWAWNVAKGKEDIADKLLADVVSNAVKEEINILEPELIKNPIPRHAARPSKKKTAPARHVKRQDTVEEVEETPTPMLAAAEEQIWPKSFDAEMPKAKFPALPKPASQAVSAPRITDAPPLRLNPSKKRVVLRAANPNDRASSVAAADDFTGRRLASRARKIADERYEERQRLRQEDEAPAIHQDIEPMKIAIFGSCVSRDTAEFMPEAEVVAYVARHSVTSLESPHGTNGIDLSDLTSAFQKRMVTSDLKGTGIERIVKNADDLDVVLTRLGR